MCLYCNSVITAEDWLGVEGESSFNFFHTWKGCCLWSLQTGAVRYDVDQEENNVSRAGDVVLCSYELPNAQAI